MTVSALLARLTGIVLICSATLCGAQDRPVSADVLNLEAQAHAEVSPDLAVMTLAVVREGTDSAALSQEIHRVLTQGLAEAKATPGIQAATGNYSTSPRYDNKGQRTGWQLRAELVLKAKDFGVLGKLAGKLSNTLQIAQSGFELSPELLAAEEEKLMQQAIAAFQAKARSASKTLGFGNFSFRELHLGSVQVQGGAPAPMFRQKMMAAAEAMPVPIESGKTILQLAVSGSIQMRR